MATYYADRAHEYERICDKPERQADLQQLRCTVQSRFSGLEVFELACGTGYWTELLASSANWVFATDINEEVLTLARARTVDRRRVMFQREDAYALPALPRTFTGGFAGFWWSHLPRTRIRDFLRGFHRVLSPGARVMFIDNTYVEGSSTPISRTAPDGDTYQLRRLDDGSTHEVIKNFPTKPELIAAVDGSAKDVQVEFLRYYWVLQYTFAP
ncbi:MAG: methyltransferase domain-containing protein [Verrucomicrobia bacterium]|nr:methyltransferase domain-containing protein [Verrucomicrobiota bacterium]